MSCLVTKLDSKFYLAKNPIETTRIRREAVGKGYVKGIISRKSTHPQSIAVFSGPTNRIGSPCFPVDPAEIAIARLSPVVSHLCGFHCGAGFVVPQLLESPDCSAKARSDTTNWDYGSGHPI